MSDAELLERFVRDKDSEAFRILMDRHLPMVYATAMRVANGDAALAKDISQEVFAALAKKAAKVARLNGAGGWLYNAARYQAMTAVREARRRRMREIAAHPELMNADEVRAEWEQLRPLLDQVLSELSESDREAIVLRFFQNLDYAALGERIGRNADAARFRVTRALDRMRKRLGCHGVESTGVALGLVLSNRIDAAVPPGLCQAVMSTAVAPPAAAGIGLMAAAGGWITLLAGAASLGTFAVTGVYAYHEWSHAQDEASRLQASIDEASLRQAELRQAAASLSRRAGTAAHRESAADSKPKSNASGYVPPDPKHLPSNLIPLSRDPRAHAAFAAFFRALKRANFAPFLRQQGYSEAQIDRMVDDEGGDACGFIGDLALEPTAEETLAKQRAQAVLSQVDGSAYSAYNRTLEATTAVEDLAAQSVFEGDSLSAAQGQKLFDAIVATMPKQQNSDTVPSSQVDWETVEAEAAAFLTPGQSENLKRQASVASVQTFVSISTTPGADYVHQWVNWSVIDPNP